MILMLFISRIPSMLIITLSIIFHESFHIITAKILNCPVNRIEISMFGGTCNIDMSNCKRKYKVFIYISGVFSNVLIITLFLNSDFIYKDTIINYNIIMIIFSLLPIYPLDGYRILSCYLPYKLIKKISIITIFIIMIIDIYLKSIGILILCFYLLTKSVKIKEEESNKEILRIYENIKASKVIE